MSSADTLTGNALYRVVEELRKAPREFLDGVSRKLADVGGADVADHHMIRSIKDKVASVLELGYARRAVADQTG